MLSLALTSRFCSLLVKNTPAADAWEATKQIFDDEKQQCLEQIKEIEG